ncbi:MAG: triose-phosphate isomerase [Candidatus Magasanikbacteria bacterium CG10_big_fil_rev_8_21_14_0_10_36_32]|uniref:Triosephosphate isomerase n=1 Tax=Candidatus Magasanikbacteria bacterium CG10_big_fil_rev_8_21_14_0_10_36_32 TaxID=1974646 RepID=A0A2M6W602_9BACT|nr:MAG: triose-phosphate isomerase [Candidatus Magasanikbacteria bacterium CG10_big_fil_rev_8_21_14_0_10_36_32]
MKKKQIYIFANWKMYLDYDESNIFANRFSNVVKEISKEINVVVFPEALSLYTVGQVLGDVGVGVGAQNVYWLDKGGYTGEISAKMYKDAGCKYSLVGHSERRHIFNETNQEVRKKLEAILSKKMIPVLCVGETAKERKTGKADKIIEIQLRSALSGLTLNAKKEIIIAYEPVWAIGTGQACDADEAERMHALIAKIVKKMAIKANFKILYGGSVDSGNVSAYLIKKTINGVLVGGASAKFESWYKILKTAEKLNKK